MNIQTERLENHTARFTVEVAVERFEKAKHSAAEKFAKRLNIPGFRKGKAPYRVVLGYVGEPAIVEEAIEIVGSEVYKEVLAQSDIDPFGSGQLEDVKVEGSPVFVFTVPLQPTVNLNDYRSLRLPYEVPTVEDEAVDRALKSLREQHALIEESQHPVAPGNRVTVDIHAWLVGEDDDEDDDEDDELDDIEAFAEHVEEDEDDDDHLTGHGHGKMLIDEHDAQLMLDEENELAPGFSQALAGAEIGETREFELDYPDDEEYEHLAGKRARFSVMIKKIENMTLPLLNDDFAARVTEKEEKPLTLLELRMRVRENLQKMVEERTRSDYATLAINAITDGATINYPEALVAEQVDQLLQQFDQDLRRQRGITLNDYMKIFRKSIDDLYAQFRETAVRTIERALVLRELIQAEQIAVADDRLEEEIATIMARFGERAEEFRQLFIDPAMRESVRNDLLSQQVMERVVAIAKGDVPEADAASAEVLPAPTDEYAEQRTEPSEQKEE